MSEPEAAELTSLATALEDVTTRITAIAERLSSGPRALAATDLFEVERSLDTARRRLEKVVTDLG